MELKICLLLIREVHDPSSNRISILKEDPIVPAHRAKIKYKIPMSLWFVE